MEALVLARCVPDDAAELARAHYEIFSRPPTHQVVFAGVNPADLIARYQKGFREGIERQEQVTDSREATYLKVTDKETNEIAAYIIWVYLPRGYDPNEDPQANADDMPAGINGPLAREFKSMKISLRGGHEGRNGPHFLLSLLGTRPKHERRGAASMLIRWMFDRADNEGLLCYVDATITGHALYERLGFKDVSTIEVDLDRFEGGEGHGVQTWMGMMREPKGD